MTPSPADLPEAIAAQLAGARTDGRNQATSSTAMVLRYRRAGNDLFLKIQRHVTGDLEPGLEPEHEVLRWLAGDLGAPHSLGFCQVEETQYLLTEAMPGRAAHSLREEAGKPRLVQLLAEGLRRVHALSAAGCPYGRSGASMVARTRACLASGVPRGEARDEAEAALAALQDKALPDEDPVFTHGDYCLPNVLIDGDAVGGVIDWGYAGVGDRYRDFVAAGMSITRNLGEDWVAPFFAAYGAQPDPERMEVHQRLYELW